MHFIVIYIWQQQQSVMPEGQNGLPVLLVGLSHVLSAEDLHVYSGPSGPSQGKDHRRTNAFQPSVILQ